jgi:hypothetical protein
VSNMPFDPDEPTSDYLARGEKALGRDPVGTYPRPALPPQGFFNRDDARFLASMPAEANLALAHPPP